MEHFACLLVYMRHLLVQPSSCDPFNPGCSFKCNLMGFCSVQELDDTVGLAENGKDIEAGSVLFGNVLKGPQHIAAPAAPAGPTGTGTPPTPPPPAALCLFTKSVLGHLCMSMSNSASACIYLILYCWHG